jgi:PST family polysaccharide transporter
MRIDQVMINFLLDKRDLGLFSAAIPFSTAIYFVPMALSVVLTPILSKIRAQSIERYLNLFKSIYTGLWILLIPYCVIMSLVSPYLIKLFYGNKYDGAEDVLRILVYTAIPVSLGVVQGIWIVNEKLNNINLYKSIIGACSNVIFNFLLIPRFGIVGAAFSTLISYFLSAMVSNLFFCRDVFFAQLPKFNRGLIYELLKL